MNDLRCTKCGKKIAEVDISEGTISILCNHRVDGNRCKHVNKVKFSKTPATPKTSPDAVYVVYNKVN